MSPAAHRRSSWRAVPTPAIAAPTPGIAILTLGIAALFLAGIAAAQETAEDPGRLVYDKWCTPCHGAGPGKPGTTVLAARYGSSRPALLEERDDLTPAFLTTFVRQGVGVMPPFRKTEITDAELEAMIGWLLGDARP